MNESTRTKAYTVVAILCGSLAAVSGWRALHPHASLSDAQARSLGYASADEEADAKRFLMATVMRKKVGPRDLKAVQAILRNGSQAARTQVISGLGFVEGVDQHRDILRTVDEAGMAGLDRVVWRVSLQRWIQYQRNPGEASFLTAYPNPEVAAIAREVVGAKS